MIAKQDILRIFRIYLKGPWVIETYMRAGNPSYALTMKWLINHGKRIGIYMPMEPEVNIRQSPDHQIVKRHHHFCELPCHAIVWAWSYCKIIDFA